MKTLLSVYLLLLLLLLSNIPASSTNSVNFHVLVENCVKPAHLQIYTTYVPEGGILLGGLRRLQESTEKFEFSYKEHPDYGHSLLSINGVYITRDTYWELLVRNCGGTECRRVAIGCYIPKPGEVVNLRYRSSRGDKCKD